MGLFARLCTKLLMLMELFEARGKSRGIRLVLRRLSCAGQMPVEKRSKAIVGIDDFRRIASEPKGEAISSSPRFFEPRIGVSLARDRRWIAQASPGDRRKNRMRARGFESSVSPCHPRFLLGDENGLLPDPRRPLRSGRHRRRADRPSGSGVHEGDSPRRWTRPSKGAYP